MTNPETHPIGKASKTRRPIRENLEAFGIAVLMAALLKPLVIEAYQIPTSSMQPTMMGSAEAGVFDRLVVDKLWAATRKPDRWDIAVFRFPIRQNQNYVKRIVGIPKDRMRIVCGNFYLLDQGNEIQSLARKPDDLQERLWREIFPARRHLQDTPAPIGDFWLATGGCRLDGDRVVAETNDSTPGRISFADRMYGGLANRIFDGYPTAVARDILKKSGVSNDRDGVQDVRLSYQLDLQAMPKSIRTEIDITHSGSNNKKFAFELEDGRAFVRVYLNGSKDFEQVVEVPIAKGRSTHVSFAHIDDELVLLCDHNEVARVDISKYRILTDIEAGKVYLGIGMTGTGSARISELRVERDQHYTRSNLPVDHVIEVPAGHYFMMGDNTLQSADARDWQGMTLGVLPDGRICPPDLKKHPDAKLIVGNFRLGDLNEAKPEDIINDENPVVVKSRDRIVFTDLAGEVHVLKGHTAPASAKHAPLFGDEGSEWKPILGPVMFVPEEHILGRPVANFWPIWPFGPHRLMFLR